MYFLDTNILLDYVGDYSEFGYFCVSSVSFEELDKIKKDRYKSDDVKRRAREVMRWFLDNTNTYKVALFSDICLQFLKDKNLCDTPDNRILACCKFEEFSDPDITFLSEDINCLVIARDVFDIRCAVPKRDDDEYKGFLEISLNDEEMAQFYQDFDKNSYNLFKNQYILIKNFEGEIVDSYRWDGVKYVPLFKKPIKSLYFEKLKSKDIYQSCAIDALMNCTITALSGKAGSGKSLLSLMAAMYLIETGKYDRLVVLFNPTKTRGASDLGYYAGDFLDKALQNSIGHILTTKFGDRYAVDLLLSQNKLKLVSMADCRGMEIADNEILWITEAQNTSVDLIKLCLSRVSSGAKVIIEGDYQSQVDSSAFSGQDDGLKRVIDVFKGHEEFGYVQLQNVWRSRIAQLCELL